MGEQHPRWPHTGATYPEWTWQVSEKLHQTITEGLRDAQDTKRWADQHGNAETAQTCAIRIEIYEQIAAELDQRDAAARERYQSDHRQWSQRRRYTGMRNGLWADVLRWARTGELPADWRDHLPGYHARVAAIAGEQVHDDIDGLVLHEFVTLPTQPWEPYAAGGDWRAALDAWYRDALTAHDRQHQDAAEIAASEPPRFATPLDTDHAAQLACRHADSQAIKAINYARKRDRLEAWYRAGRAAGGDNEDWAGWYRDRIGTWDRRQDTIYGVPLIRAERELAGLGDPWQMVEPAAAGGWTRVAMQTLPDYWLHRTPTAAD